MDFNKIKEMGLEYAEKGKNAALDLAEKGKTQALIVNEQGKLLKAQRQLGALVYSLAKGKEENQPLVDKYIEMIDNIEQEIARLKASLTPAEAAEAEYVVHEEVPADRAGRAQSLPAVRCSRLGRCTVLQQVRCTAVIKRFSNRAALPTGHRPVFASGKCRRNAGNLRTLSCKTA